MRRSRRCVLVVVSALALVLAMSPQYALSSTAWQGSGLVSTVAAVVPTTVWHGSDYATVSGSRLEWIDVCDREADGHGVWADY
jgi:hypothetical protein